MAATMNAATFMGKNFLDNQNSIMNSTDLTLKKMFDISAKLVGEQEEINNVDKIHWEKPSWKHLSLIGDETVINLQRAKVYVFSDSVLCLGRVHQHPQSNKAWKERIGWIITDRSYRDYDGINGEPTEFEWNMFPGFTTLQLCGKVTDLLSRLGETPETFTGRIPFISMFNDISCDKKDNEEECVANAKVVSILARKFGIGQWSFIGPGSEKKWYSMEENSPQGITLRKRCCWNLQKSGCPIFLATTPFSRGKLKSKGHGKLFIHFAADQETIETIFRIIVFANQLSLYGAVANMCEEFESLHDRSGQPDVLMGQSIVLSEIKAEVPLENDIPSHQNLLLQRYEERIEMLSQKNKVSKFCMDAGFISVVEVGQYFMIKDTGDVTQFHTVACREYTLPRNDGSSQPKGWIQGNTKIGPILEITTSCLYGKHGIEIRIWSLGEDDSQSRVRISHGSHKFVIDSNHNNTEVPADLPEEQTSQLKMKDFAARSKANATPHRRELVDLPSIFPINERKWIDIEPGDSSLSAYEISKKIINLPRDSQTVQREDDGAVQFWRIKNYLRNQFPQVQYWSDDRWKLCLAAAGGAKRIYQYCTDISGTIVYFRALQGHSGRNLIDPSLQDNVIIQSGFCQHIYHIGCDF